MKYYKGQLVCQHLEIIPRAEGKEIAIVEGKR